MNTKTIMVLVVLISALGLVITASAKQAFATKYTLNVPNVSTSYENFIVLQKSPGLGLQGILASHGLGAHSIGQEALGAIGGQISNIQIHLPSVVTKGVPFGSR